MLWPCEHVMAWDDRDGWDFNKHFHRCWKTTSLCSLYGPTVQVLMSLHLDAVEGCYPPAPAVKRGRHRYVRIESGKGLRKATPDLGLDEFYRPGGQLFVRYPIQDDTELQQPVPGGRRNIGSPACKQTSINNQPGWKVKSQVLKMQAGRTQYPYL
jgi:hypothetical protein